MEPNMENVKNKKITIDELETLRDELRLQMHLFKKETETQWQELEHQWKDLKASSPTIHATAAEAAGDVYAAGGLLKETLYNGYLKIRHSLNRHRETHA
jgi:hypothetical protein